MALNADEELELLQLQEADYRETLNRDKRRGYRDETPSSNLLEATTRGGIDSLTGGYIDEFSGALKHPVGAFKAATGDGSADEDVKAYQGERDKVREIYNRARAEHPYASFAGNVGGAVVGPGKLMKGLKGAKAIATAAGLGGVAGLGLSEAELADQEYGQAAKDTAVGAAVGGVTEGIAQKISSKLAARRGAREASASAGGGAPPGGGTPPGKEEDGILSQLFRDAKPSKNSAEIQGAVKEISGQEKVPSWMLTEDRQTQNLANTLLKSPTIGGEMERKVARPIQEGLEKFGADVAERGGGLSQYEAGKSAGEGIASAFQERIKPAQVVYDAIEDKFKDVPLDRIAFTRAITKLRKQFGPKVQSGAPGLIDEVERAFGEVQDVAGLRKMRTSLGEYLTGTPSKAQKDVVMEMYDVLTRERDRSILRNSITTGPKIARGGKADTLLRQLKGADRIYRDEMTRTAEALGVQGSRSQGTKAAIDGYLRDTAPEQLAKDLFNRGDFDSLQRLQKTFPEQFETLKKRALSELVEKSQEGGRLSTQRLSTNLSKYGPEVQQLLMGDLFPKAQAAKTTLAAMPRNFNPSDTSVRWQFLNLGDTRDNAMSLVQRAALNRQTQNLGTLAKAHPTKTAQLIQTLRSKPAGHMFADTLEKAAGRGDAAFASTYYLLSQSSPEFRKLVDDGHK